MSLKYALIENLLTARKDDYTAQVQDVVSHDMDSIIEKMLQKGSTITKTDILAVLNSFFELAGNIVAEGGTINTELINTNFSIQGVFDGAADNFDSNKHRIKVNVNAGKKLKEAVHDIQLEKVDTLEVLPHILEVKDSISGSVNENISSAGVIEITGSRLKIQGDDAKNGVYLVAQDGKTHKIATLVDNKPAKLIAILPALTSGEYTLRVITQYSGSNTLKDPKTGVFNKPLTII